MWGDTGDRPPPTYKQCIGELMRTGYCPPFVVLLVAKIDIEQLPPPNDDVEAFRLYLTDGEYVMQAIIRSETYRFITTGETEEGSYIMLDDYEVRKQERAGGVGKVAYLAVANFHTVGHSPAYASQATTEQDGGAVVETEFDDVQSSASEEAPLAKKRKLEDGETLDLDGTVEREVLRQHSLNGSRPSSDGRVTKRAVLDDDDKENNVPDGEPNRARGTNSSANQQISQVTDGDDQAIEAAKAKSPTHEEQRINGYSREFYEKEIVAHHERCHGIGMPVRGLYNKTCSWGPWRDIADDRNAKKKLAPTSKMLLACHSLSQAAVRAIEGGVPLKRVARALNVLGFSEIPRLPHSKRQNHLVDVFAVVHSVSDVSNCKLGPKRELRLVDATTDKRVLLSVFADPQNFTPDVGTVALFRSVKTHRFDGYSLNAYAKDCAGYDWFIPNPDWICEGTVRRLHERWSDLRQIWRAIKPADTPADLCHEECAQNYDVLWKRRDTFRRLEREYPDRMYWLHRDHDVDKQDPDVWEDIFARDAAALRMALPF